LTRYRIGFDIGGTFTDFVFYDQHTHHLSLHKKLTTPDDPSIGALEGLDELAGQVGVKLVEVSEIIHGTTLVTNAIIERKGPPVALLTTRGFRDVLEMGTEQRYDIYDLFLRYPSPIVPRRRRIEITERIDRDGRVVTPIDLHEVREAAAQIQAQGVEAVAVCFLHAYSNRAHERAVADLLACEFPSLAVSISSDVVAELREYPRTVTTCANAYVRPLVDRYLGRLESALASRGFRGAFWLMHSAGGLISTQTARALPIRLLESGPAGGALATALFGAQAGLPDAIAFDMGGTTAKTCLLENGRAEIVPMLEAGRVHRFKKGSGLPIKTPVVDMIEIGAGGGSIATVDEVGLLRVGPHSAGADPGPACYGRGGMLPTVTDANLLLGYYDPAFFLGGSMQLDRDAASRAVAGLGAALSLSEIETAWGIHKVVTEGMAAAARVHLVEKGKDPRRYAMVGFGGAGPAHAVGVARILGIRQVIVPPASGAASALGFLVAPLSSEHVRSLPTLLAEGFDAALVNRTLDELEQEGRARLQAAGVALTAMTVERSADMRLLGQMHEIAVPLPAGALDATRLGAIEEAFASEYTARYSALYGKPAIEAITWRVRVVAPQPDIQLQPGAGDDTARRSLKGKRAAYFSTGFVEAAVHDRYALRAGDRIVGPAIVEERESTTVLPPGTSLQVDAVLNLCIAIDAVVAPQAIVRADMSVPEAIRAIEADPVSLEIMWSRLVTIADEMWATVIRTAFSLIISESQDFASELLDAEGESLAHSPRSMPVFNLSLPRAVKAMLEKFPARHLKPGDVLITNDPWLCAGHLFDIVVVTPVFHEERMVALMGTVGHVNDIGGTKDSLRARELYEEGIQIPPMMLYRSGVPNDDLFTLLAENVRNPDQVIGDVRSFVAANAMGAARLLDFMREYGVHDLRALAAVVQNRSERAMRDAIRALPDGVHTAEIFTNPLGEPMRLPLKLTIAGDSMAIDFDGAPPQADRGGINCTLNYTASHATYPLKCMLTPTVRSNAGCYRPMRVSAPEGSVLNCRKPASVNLRLRTGWYIAPNIFTALAPAAPEAVQAFTGLPVAIGIYGRDAHGAMYADHLFLGGGQGGGAACDGNSSLLWPTSAAGTSIELFESRVPVLVIEKRYLTDSGGAGQFRGGLGQRVRLTKLYDDRLPTLASIYPEGVGVEAAGLYGGRAGSTVYGKVVDTAARREQDCGTGELATLTCVAEVAEVALAGGSGYGDPLARAVEAVRDDVLEERVSREVAQRDYGVVIDAGGNIDARATQLLRAARQPVMSKGETSWVK
jgi:5-oxoprolinase (ATP-hydrolysing)/N-methylhydantoinase A